MQLTIEKDVTSRKKNDNITFWYDKINYFTNERFIIPKPKLFSIILQVMYLILDKNYR